MGPNPYEDWDAPPAFQFSPEVKMVFVDLCELWQEAIGHILSILSRMSPEAKANRKLIAKSRGRARGRR